MEEDRMPKKIFNQELEGTRRRGRPRKRWKEEVERYLRVLGESWWQIGKNGRALLDKPKPTVGCSANGRRRRLKKEVEITEHVAYLKYGRVAYRVSLGKHGWGGVHLEDQGLDWRIILKRIFKK